MTYSKSLITLNEPHSMASESYRMFRTNLHYMDVDTKHQVIMFTSTFMEEGKTTSAANAAITYAQDGKKTLIIECDLRKARLHEIFEIPQFPGFTNIMVDKTPWQEMIKKLPGVDNLDIITSGPLPPNPAELLGSDRIQAFITEAREKYDIIIIDTPPVLSVADATVLTKVVDGVVLVVASNETKIDDLKKAKKKLDQVGAKVLGTLLSKANFKGKKYYKYYGKKG